MNICMMAYRTGGGAGRAAVRLLRGLKQYHDVKCEMLVIHRDRMTDDAVRLVKCPSFYKYVQKRYFEDNIYPGHVLMSMMYSGTEDEYLKRIRHCDIVHLHWVSNFVSAESLHTMCEMGKGLVWTFHDLNPMTGGCHCAYGCDKYIQECSGCSQMRDNPYDITAAMLKVKKKYIPSNLVVVTPSKWLADCAKRSAIFCNHRIEVIPNSIETDIFQPDDRLRAREEWEIHPNSKVILYCSDQMEHIHKGYTYFKEAIARIRQEPMGSQWTAQNQIQILLVGNCPSAMDDVQSMGIPCKATGYIKDDIRMAKAYAAADVTVLPSLEDNYPNIMLESLACGTPVVGFETGGIPDLILDGKTGFVVKQRNSSALGQAIVAVLNAPGMRKNCRETAERCLSQKIQAERYRALYDDVLAKCLRRPKREGPFELSKDAKRILGIYTFDIMEQISHMNGMQRKQWLKSFFWDEILDYATDVLGTPEQYGDATIAIWGTGAFAKSLLGKLIQKSPAYAKKFACFLDNNSNKSSFYGYPKKDIFFLLNDSIKIVIIGTIQYEDEVCSQIESYGNDNLQIMRFGKMYLRYFWGIEQ